MQPGGQDLGLEGNVDSATANWLSQSYAGVSSSAASGGSSRPRQGSATAAGAGSQLDSVPEDGKEKDAAGEADLEIGLLDPAEAERLRLLQLDKAQKGRPSPLALRTALSYDGIVVLLMLLQW